MQNFPLIIIIYNTTPLKPLIPIILNKYVAIIVVLLQNPLSGNPEWKYNNSGNRSSEANYTSKNWRRAILLLFQRFSMPHYWRKTIIRAWAEGAKAAAPPTSTLQLLLGFGFETYPKHQYPLHYVYNPNFSFITSILFQLHPKPQPYAAKCNFMISNL